MTGSLRLPATVLLAALAAAPALAETAPSPAAEPRAIATVNGEALFEADLERALGKLHGSVEAGSRAAFDLERLLFRMVNDTLLGQEARALGMDADGGIPERVAAFHTRLARSALEREEIATPATPTDEEVRAAFEDQYRELTLRVVTAYERREADELLALLEGGADMESLARERSVDPYAARGGRVEGVARVDLTPEIAELATSLEPGELAGPVRTDLGWSVIRLVEVRPADPERFAAAEPTLRRLVRHKKAQGLRAALARAARERHPVRIDDAVTGTLAAERRGDGRLVPRFADPEAVVARIGETALTAAAYSKALLARWSGVRNEEAALAAAPIVLDKLIEERLLEAEAEGRDYGRRPEIARRVRAFETDLLVQRYLEEVVAAGVEVGREEMEAYYRDHRDRLRKPPRLHLGQITVATLEEAERIAGLLRAGSELAWLARRHSTDRFKDSGGDRGWVSLEGGGFDPRLAEAEAGAVLDPVGVRGNYVVLKVLARQEQGAYPFEEVSGNVRQAVFSEKLRAAIERLMDTLRARSEIVIDRELLAGLEITGTVEAPEEGDGEHAH